MNTPMRTLAAAVATAFLPVALSACTAGDSRAARDHASASSGADARGRAAAAACMRDKGYDEPDPDPNQSSAQVAVPDGVDPDRYAQDSADCSEQAGISVGKAQPLPQSDQLLRQVAACVREHGFSDYPDDESGQRAYAAHDDTRFIQVVEDCETDALGSDAAKVG